MNNLSIEKRKAVIAALVEGSSINATARMVGVSKPTILKLLRELGAACIDYHDTHLRNLKPKRIECDEVWSFVFAKQKHLRPEVQGTLGLGDTWLWVAIDPVTKLIIAYHVGQRTLEDARQFMLDLAGRVTSVTQLTTDGLVHYPKAVQEAFGDNVDYAQLVKVYGGQESPTEAHRYSPPKFNGSRKYAVIGAPHPNFISTSIIERQTLNLRMGIRRFTRLTNAHSKKFENHDYAIAMFLMFYNFCRIHGSLGVTPAMAAGLTHHVWELEELIGLLD